MSASSKIFKSREWSMGNGQCEGCGGLGPKFYNEGNPWPGREAKDLGHKPTCKIAQAMKEDGEEDVLMLGDLL